MNRLIEYTLDLIELKEITAIRKRIPVYDEDSDGYKPRSAVRVILQWEYIEKVEGHAYIMTQELVLEPKDYKKDCYNIEETIKEWMETVNEKIIRYYLDHHGTPPAFKHILKDIPKMNSRWEFEIKDKG